MRFETYLTEGQKFKEFDTDDEFADFMKKNCAPYFKLLKGKTPIRRSVTTGNTMGYTIMIKDVRTDRRPRGSLTDVEFNWFNQHLKAHGHISRAEAVMTSSRDIGNFGNFGESFLFFPMGNFNYTWMEALDFNYQDEKTKWDYHLAKDTVGIPYKTNRQSVEQEDIVDSAMIYFHTNEMFDKAHKKGYEIWFDCRQYILMKDFQYDFIRELI